MADSASPAANFPPVPDRDNSDASALFGVRREAVGLSVTVALVTVIFLASFWPALFTGDVSTIAGRTDFHELNGPKAYFLDVRLQHGEFPLWDPLTLTGMPYAAHPLTMAFYPPNLIRALITRPVNAIEFFRSMYYLILFHFIVAAAGLYLLARREGLSMASSVVVSIAVPFCERWISNSLWQLPMLCAVAWMPVVLLFLREAAHSPAWRRRAAWAILAGLAYGFQILGGWPQVAINATFLYIVFFVLCIVRTEFQGPPSFSNLRRLVASAIWPCLLFGLVGAFVGLALMLPASEFIHYSGRSSANFAKFSRAGIMMNISSLAGLYWDRLKYGEGFLAYVYNFAEDGDTWFSLNLALLVLAFSAIFVAFRYRTVVSFVLTLLAFDLSFGPPMPVSELIQRFFPFAPSTPYYTSVTICTPLVLLAGFALDRILAWGRTASLPRSVSALLLILGLPIVGLAAEPPDSDPGRSLLWSSLPAGILLLLIFGRRIRHWRALVICSLIAESALCGALISYRDLVGVGVFRMPFLGDAQVLERPPNTELRRPRVICKSCNGNVWAMESSINGYDPLTLYSAFDVLANPGEESVYKRGPEVEKNLRAAAVLKRQFWLASCFVRGVAPEKDRLFPPTRAVFIDSSRPIALPELGLTELPASTVATPELEIEIWDRNETADEKDGPHVQSARVAGVRFPRRNHALRIYYRSPGAATIQARITGNADPEQQFRIGPVPVPPAGDAGGVFELPMPDFESAQIAVALRSETALPKNAIGRLTLVEDNSDEIDRVAIKKSFANEIALHLTDLPDDRALVFTEMSYPGWSATLDGAPVPILPAYGAYQAVVVPAGSHEVTFRFRPWRVYAGAAISLTTLLLAMLAIPTLFLWRRARLGPVGAGG